MSAITIRSVTYTVPVLDAKGEPVAPQKIKYNGREIEVPVVDHVRLNADTIVTDPVLAKDLIAGGHARLHDAALDGEAEEVIDPTLS